MNPFVPIARFALEHDRRQKEAGMSYYLHAEPLMFWLTFPFVFVATLCSVALFINEASDHQSMVPAMVSLLVPLGLLGAAFSAFSKMREMRVSPDRQLVEEGLEICKMIVKDKTLDREWRRRAAAVSDALNAIESRRRRYELLPSVDMATLSGTVKKLHEAAVALAHYQMLAGLSAHAEVVAHDVDTVLAALRTLPA